MVTPRNGRSLQLKVIKADGSVEEYLHTKIIGTFNNALALVEQSNVYAAEQFAEAITFYLYDKHTEATINSDQIHLMVQAVLASTGYQNAARALNEYHLGRRIKRRRTEVIEDFCGDDSAPLLWSKSRIVEDLTTRDGLDRHVARAIASAVEEKVLKLGLTRIRKSLIRELVAAEADAMLEAHRHLQYATP